MTAGCVYVFMGTYQPMQPTIEEYIHGSVRSSRRSNDDVIAGSRVLHV